MMTDHERYYVRAWEIVAEYQRGAQLPSFIETDDCASEVYLALVKLHDCAHASGKQVTHGLEWLRGRDTITKHVDKETLRQRREGP